MSKHKISVGYCVCVIAATVWIVGCSEYAPSSPPPAVETPPPEPEPVPATSITVQQKAAVGVGKKGRGYGEGFVATPIGSLFAFRERAVFDIQIPEAMKLFKAQEDRPPKDHEEFMEKIIKANHIKLPELPDEHRYQYDPETEQLMVLSPAES
ncbi:MAG: hypothetical protein KKE86_06760 [Planctomycetes bacterium]|nr:hypothetical protein [Planctomycetota bacterium]MBU4399023.1 hypothetical protein [Planctomycetota bacterium]MCG2682985.1 hypothetical protein [Planctomycetales bacterium]